MTRILVVDDEASIRELFRAVLEGEGHQVEVAADGKQAMDIMTAEPAEVMITDIVMPEKEGIETIKELRELYGDLIKIVAVSGGGRVAGDHYLVLANRLGADLTLEKPVTAEQLVAAVNKVLEP